ncbi:uncharacterized protein LOC141706739 isoform X2 [Apium graveolens]|uniref:uncharacterized protein LOC141706739 isoform X2 n=1 Tax=Apium graveolens TaxID=4045 RepID=UPI003D796672
MGRPPSNGVPSFRFNAVEVSDMEAMLVAHDFAMPSRELLDALAEKFSLAPERSGKSVVQMKQVWHWFQNRRYAHRAKASRAPETSNLSPLTQDGSSIMTNMPQAPQSKPVPRAFTDTKIDVTEAPQSLPSTGCRNGADSSSMEFEAKSARDGAWYDVAMFLSYRSSDAVDPEVLVRFAGFGAEEDEWVDIGRLVRKRSLPCESSECVAVLQGDLILCFQEGKEQALYYDAHVLDAQRRRHDVRGCRCRFLVRYDHDQSEEIVPLRKVCRRPETDYRLQQLYASNEPASTNQSKAGAIPTNNTLRVYPPVEPKQKQRKIEDLLNNGPVLPGTSQTNLLAGTEIKALQTNVADIMDAGSTGNSSTPQSSNSSQRLDMKTDSPGTVEVSDSGNSSPQPQDMKTDSPGNMEILDTGNNSPQPQDMKTDSHGNMETSDAGNNSPQPQDLMTDGGSTVEILDSGDNSLQPQVIKIASPSTTQISDAANSSLQTQDVKLASPSNLEISDADNISSQPEVMNVVSPRTMDISDAANSSLQTQDTKTASLSNLEISDAGNNSLQPEVASPHTAEVSDAVTVDQLPKVTEIINGGDLDGSNVAPTNAMQQEEVAQIASAASVENSPVSPVNDKLGNPVVPPQSEVAETPRSLESADTPPPNEV